MKKKIFIILMVTLILILSSCLFRKEKPNQLLLHHLGEEGINYKIHDLTNEYGLWHIIIQSKDLITLFPNQEQYSIKVNNEIYEIEQNPLDESIKQVLIKSTHTSKEEIMKGLITNEPPQVTRGGFHEIEYLYIENYNLGTNDYLYQIKLDDFFHLRSITDFVVHHDVIVNNIKNNENNQEYKTPVYIKSTLGNDLIYTYNDYRNARMHLISDPSKTDSIHERFEYLKDNNQKQDLQNTPELRSITLQLGAITSTPVDVRKLQFQHLGREGMNLEDASLWNVIKIDDLTEDFEKYIVAFRDDRIPRAFRAAAIGKRAIEINDKEYIFEQLTNIDLNYYQVTIPSSDVSNSDEIRTGIFKQFWEVDTQKSSATAPETVSVDIAQITIDAIVINERDENIPNLVKDDFEITGTDADKLTITEVTVNNNNYSITATTTTVAGNYTYNLNAKGKLVQENIPLQTLAGIPHINSTVNRTSDETVSSRDRIITVEATVIDQYNNPITGLTKDDFAVTSESTFAIQNSVPVQNTYTLTIQTPVTEGDYTATLTAKTIAIGAFTIKVFVPDDFAGGDGTETDPYQITEWAHLDNIRLYLNNENLHFKLMNDLNSESSGYSEFASDTANDGKGWQPFGNSGSNTHFKGIFDGNNKSISDLNINREATNYVGLFGLIQNATIKNLKLTNVNIKGKDQVGVIGEAKDAKIENCSSDGTVNGGSNVGGLIGFGYNTTIENCSSDGTVNGVSSVGGLIGYGHNTTIENCSSDDTVKGRSNVGGLIGFGYITTINNSHSLAKVEGEDSIGGLVGLLGGGSTITNSYTYYHDDSSVSVKGNMSVGGLVGSLQSGSNHIYKSFSTANIEAEIGPAGGLVGFIQSHNNLSSINNSYATGNVSGTASNSGGLVGAVGVVGSVGNQQINNSYATGNVSSTGMNLGGLIGYKREDTTITNSYYDTNTSGQTDTGKGIGKTTTEMKEGLPSNDIYKDWSTEIWYFGTNEEYPKLHWEFEGKSLYTLTMEVTEGQGTTLPSVGQHQYYEDSVVPINAIPESYWVFKEWVGGVTDTNNATTTVTMNSNKTVSAKFNLFEGDGTENNPYEITNWYHLHNIRNHLNKHFILMNDLDENSTGYDEFASDTANDENGWQPIGANENITYFSQKFQGTFDGNNKSISGLHIKNYRDTGLFAIINNATIKDLNLTNLTITGIGSQPSGGLAAIAENNSNIENVHLTNITINRESTSRNIGGMIGEANGVTINNCSSSGSVKGYEHVGGLIGKAYNTTISNSYSGAKAEGDYNIGGLVGWLSGNSSITNSYTSYIDDSFSVEGYSNVGGLVGGLNGFSNDPNGGYNQIHESFSTVNVKASPLDNGGLGTLAGGLVGFINPNESPSSINNSYATGNVEGMANLGGLVGSESVQWASSNTTITNSYATGNVNGTNGLGGLIGIKREDTTITNSYYDTNTSGQTDTGKGIGKTTTEMKQGLPSNAIYKNWSTDIWYFGTHEEYPRLHWEFEGKSLYTLTMEVTEGQGTTLPSVGQHKYYEDSIVTLIAIPAEGRKFINWNIDGTELSTDNPMSYSISTENIEIKAKFERTVENVGEKKAYTANDVDFNMIRALAAIFPKELDDTGRQTVDKAYLIGETEVTYALWYKVRMWAIDNVRGVNKYTFSNAGKEGSNGNIGLEPTLANNEPVTMVSWVDVVVWTNALSEMLGLNPVYRYRGNIIRNANDYTACNNALQTDNNGFRLPTEWEWELAARYIGLEKPTNGPFLKDFTILSDEIWWTPGEYASGAYANVNSAPYVSEVSWYEDNSGTKTHDVKLKRANQLGLYDMSGNVEEWCFDKYYSDQNYRIKRGGTSISGATYMRIAIRNQTTDSSLKSSFLGFRLAMNEDTE